MSKLLRAVLVVVLVVGIAELGSKLVLQSQIAAAVKAHDPGARDVSASVSLPVVYRLATGKSISTVVVSAHNVDLVSLTADKVTATATGVHVDVASSIKHRKAEVTRIDAIDLTVTFTQQQASAILPSGYTFVFGEGTVTVQGPVTSVTGRFELRPPAQVAFTLEGTPPAGLPPVPTITFPIAPLSGCLQSVALVPGKVSLTCREPNPPIDFLPHR